MFFTERRGITYLLWKGMSEIEDYPVLHYSGNDIRVIRPIPFESVEVLHQTITVPH